MVFKYKHQPVLYFHCGRIGHGKHNCVHPETLDANMARIGYGPWMECISLQFTSILWSMSLQKLRDLMDEDNMLNM